MYKNTQECHELTFDIFVAYMYFRHLTFGIFAPLRFTNLLLLPQGGKMGTLHH